MTKSVNSKLAYRDRVENYAAYRPSYPEEAVRYILREQQLSDPADIADIGAGTGIFSAQLLKHGHRIFAVEPEAQMRYAAQAALSHFTGFEIVEGTAEATSLANRSVDLVVAAQALHWFDPARAGAEFARILRPKGRIVAIWNERAIDVNPFQNALNNLLIAMQTDIIGDRSIYAETVDDVAIRFFGFGSYTKAVFMNEEQLNHERFFGRILSASFAPKPSHPFYIKWVEEIDRVFQSYAEAGFVKVVYQTFVITKATP